MWPKYLAIFFLFLFFALLQNNFLAHFGFLKSLPNLVLIFFFVLAYFAPDKNFWQVAFYALSAGFFLDIFSYSYIGPSMLVLLAFGFLAKKIQQSLRSAQNSRPMLYFIPLFVIFFSAYEAVFYWRNVFSTYFLISIVINTIVSAAFFAIYKRFNEAV